MSDERIKALKERAFSLVEQGMNQDVSCMDAKEIGEMMDVLKDSFEACKLYHEAEYFKKINKAMDEAKDGEKVERMMEKYIPEYAYANRMNYSPYYTVYPETYPENFRMNYSRGGGRRMYSNNNSGSYGGYGNSSRGGNSSRNYGNGMRNYMWDDMYIPSDMWDDDMKSYMYKRNYMDMKHNGENEAESSKELEKYMKELSSELTDMVSESTPNEKAMLKKKLTDLASKIS